MSDFGFFTAIYRDGRVHIGQKTYSAGSFAVALLNKYYQDDTAARIAVYKQYNLAVQRELKRGYVVTKDFLHCADEIHSILNHLSILPPFTLLNTDGEHNRITALFAEDNAIALERYFRIRAEFSDMDAGAKALGVLPKEYDKESFDCYAKLLREVTETLSFYDAISEDMISAHEKLLHFISRIEEAERFDEAHLLPIAMDVFGKNAFAVNEEYISVPKTRAGKSVSVARRLHFRSYYSFMITDFFEGLHYGHYPRRCQICGKYFLMQSARRQIYCSGYVPKEMYPPRYKGEKYLSCRKLAVMLGRKERAEQNPINRAYTNRCNAIRSEKSRGTVTPEFATAALRLARRRYDEAMANDEYAKKQFYEDLSRTKLYADTDKEVG